MTGILPPAPGAPPATPGPPPPGAPPPALAVRAELSARDVAVDLTVPAGQVLALLGPNGSGKSTLLGLAAGLLRPDRGEVRLGGRTVADGRSWVPPHARRIALLTQDPSLFPHLTAVENVAFGPRAAGRGRRAAVAHAHRLLAQVGCADLADRRPHQLSGGQAQRVALARALAPDPAVLLLDEPLSALDVDAAATMRQLLRRVLRGSGRTAVLVTHDLLDVLAVADTLAVLDGGRVVEQGPTAQTLTRPTSPFVASLTGVNLVLGTLAHDRGEPVLVAPAGPAGGADGGPPAPGADALTLHGLTDPGAVVGERAAATFGPRAVAVHRRPSGGSPRNTVPVTVTALDVRGELVRVRAVGPGGHLLAADITPASVTGLDLAPGARVLFTVKAAEVTIFPA